MLEEIGLKKAIRKKDPPKNQTDFVEKVEKEKSKREEKEKLKLLEKLESQVLKIKKTNKLNFLNTTIANSITSEQTSHKRLIDHIPKNEKLIKQGSIDEKGIKFDKKLLDDSEFRKVNIKKEKIEINCEEEHFNTKKNNVLYQTGIQGKKIVEDNKINSLADEEDNLIEIEYIKNCSKDKMKFFMFKAHQIYNFLNSIKLVRYIEIFIEDGFEDLESILGNFFVKIFQ